MPPRPGACGHFTPRSRTTTATSTLPTARRWPRFSSFSALASASCCCECAVAGSSSRSRVWRWTKNERRAALPGGANPQEQGDAARRCRAAGRAEREEGGLSGGGRRRAGPEREPLARRAAVRRPRTRDAADPRALRLALLLVVLPARRGLPPRRRLHLRQLALPLGPALGPADAQSPADRPAHVQHVHIRRDDVGHRTARLV